MTRKLLIMFAVLMLVALGLGIYAWYLNRRVTDEAQHALQQQQQALEVSANAPLSPVSLVLASDADATLRSTSANLALPPERSERDRAILRALLAQYLGPQSRHTVGAGSEIRDVFLLGEDTAVVDTNAAFADAHPSGVLAEELTVESIVMTLNVNDPKIQQVKILVNGKERETLAGHADLRRFYQASELSQVVKDMQ